MRVNITDILNKYRTVAIIGLSKDPSKDSYRVAEYLKKHGFKIVPINPSAEEILGEKSYKSLLDLPADSQRTLEIIDVFRPSHEVATIVEQAIELRKLYGRPYVIWMQLGIINENAAQTALRNGLVVVMNKCIMQEHKRRFGAKE
ncbi:CoA-binding protein [Candidatus Bathyarchaeota archaeon]|nr:CoA-binding protein [Candidatus Bathyarchaeota archaeon]